MQLYETSLSTSIDATTKDTRVFLLKIIDVLGAPSNSNVVGGDHDPDGEHAESQQPESSRTS